MHLKGKLIVYIYITIMLITITFPPSYGNYYISTQEMNHMLIITNDIDNLDMGKARIEYKPIWEGLEDINFSILLMQDTVIFMIFIGFFLLYKLKKD